MYVIGGLGSYFKSISTLLEILPEHYSFDEVPFHLMSFEAKLNEENSTMDLDVA